MNYPIPAFSRRNLRAFTASLFAYLLLAGPVAPLAAASGGAARRHTPPASSAQPPSGEARGAMPAPAPLVLVPNVTATKADAFADSDMDGKAEPGETITYTVTITNNGTDATNVVFTDTVDANTTLVPGSITAQPIAAPDAYNVIGNVSISPDASQGLLVNDCDPPETNTPCVPNTGLTVTTLAGDSSAPFSGTSTKGGQVTSTTTDGAFVYNPPPGFPNGADNTDTFTYTTTDGEGKSDTATVTLTVSTPIWFIDDNAAAGGDGRLTNPYNCYTGTSIPVIGPTCFSDSAADEAGDFIFLFSGNYSGGYTLLNNQSLIGQAAGAALDAIVGATVQPYTDPLPPTGGAAPVITTTLPSTNAINIGTGNSNLLRGFTVGNTTGSKIASPTSPPAAAFGTLTASEVTLNGNGQALNLDNGTVNATFISISSNTSAGPGIVLDQIAGSITSTGGTTVTDPTAQCIVVMNSTANVTFNNTSCTLATDGISLQNNSAGTRSFGTLSVTGGSGIGFVHANSGGATTFGGAVTITNPTGNGIDIQNSNVNLSFPATSVDKGTTTNTGVNLVNNSGRTITFSTLDINTNGGVGLNANNSGAVNVTTAAGSEITSASNAAMILAGGTALGLNFTTVSSTNSTGKGIELNAVTGGIAIGTTTITNPTNIGIHALNNTNSTAGTFSFGNTAVTQIGNTGVRLEGNAKALSFADLDINTPDSNQRGLHATTNSGTITTTSGTISTTTGIAVEVVGTSSGSRTPLDMTLTSVSVNGAANGIILTNTNGPGGAVGFTVVGDGSNTSVGGNGTGGSILNTTGADDATPGDAAGIGIRLNFADEVAFRRMTLTTQANFGIYGENSSNVTVEFVTINGTNGTPGGVGAGDGDASVAFHELTGAALVKDTTLSGSIETQMRVINSGSTNLNRLVINNCTFGAMDSGTGDDAILVQARDTSVLNVTIQDSDFNAARGDIFQFDLTHTATGDLIFDNNTINNQFTPQPVVGGGGITLSGGGTSNAAPNLTYEFDNNTFRGARGTMLLVIWQTGSGSASGRIEGNTFGVSGVNGSCSTEASCVEIRTEGRGAHTVLINNNTIRQYGNFGIYMEMDGINTGGSTGTIGSMNATVTNNTIEQPSTGPFPTKNGVHVNFGATSGDNYTGCFDILNNNAPNSGQTDAGAGTDYVLRQRMLTTMQLPGYAGGSTNIAAVATYIQGRNTGTETVFVATPTGGGGYVNSPGGAQCTQPPAVPPMPSTSRSVLSNMKVTAETAAPYYAPPVGGPTSYFASRSLFPVPSRLTKAAPAVVGSPKQAQRDATAAKAQKDSGTVLTRGKGETRRIKPVISAAGETIEVNIGTLRAGDSVEITFQVTVANPYSGGPTVSNQGTVTFAETGSPVLTDDPATGAPNDATLTPIDSINIVAQDATVAEPTSGTTDLLFTVTLSAPATAPVTVDFTTVTGGANPATVGTCPPMGSGDYVLTSGQVNFAVGQQVQTIGVPVCSDSDNGETDEHLLLRLSNAVGGTIIRGELGDEALGTITTANTPGAILISELRTSGPGGSADDFVEIYNNSASAHTVDTADNTGYGVFKMGATINDTPILVGTIPEGTVLQPRGHYLFVGSQYSLSLYPAGVGTFADGDATLSSDIENNRNVGIFKTANPANLSSVLRLDAVGFGLNTGANANLLREGSTLPAVAGVAPFDTPATTTQYTFFRSMCSFVSGVGCTVTGTSKDTNNNSADFLFADTEGSTTPASPAGQERLGAPGPEGSDSPLRKASGPGGIDVLPLDRSVATSAGPNRSRFSQIQDPGGTFGTLVIRRRVENNTASPITRLRFRIVEVTTYNPSDPGNADLRALDSTPTVVMNIGDADTCADTSTPPGTPNPCTVDVQGTTVETPPLQPNGGAFNSTMTVTLGTPLAVGDSVNVQFRLGLEQTGLFRFLIIVEALP